MIVFMIVQILGLLFRMMIKIMSSNCSKRHLIHSQMVNNFHKITQINNNLSLVKNLRKILLYQGIKVNPYICQIHFKDRALMRSKTMGMRRRRKKDKKMIR